MINADMKLYNYYVYEDADGYGQAQLSKDIKGSVRMAINITNQSTQDNIKYINCSYMGLTFDNSINDTFVIEYGNEKLKVEYINKRGRLNQVFMGEL